MKKTIIFLAGILIALLLIPAAVYADDDIAGGTYFGIDWRVTSDHQLIIGKEGETQQIDALNFFSPWRDDDVRGTIESVRFAGTVKVLGDLWGTFEGLENMKTADLTGLETWGTSTMENMFKGCSSLKNLDLSGFDTRSVTDMSGMFSGCSALESVDLSSFSTGRVEKMDRMFSGCSSLKEIDLSSFDMLSLESEQYSVFYGTAPEIIRSPALLKINIPLPAVMYDSEVKEYDALPTEQIRNITLYADRETAAASEPDPAVSGVCDGVDWMITEDDVLVLGKEGEEQTFEARDSRTPMEWDGYGHRLETYFYPWNKYRPFIKGVRFAGTVHGRGNMEYLFYDMRKAETVDLSGFDTSQVTGMRDMFSGCGAKELDLSGFDTGNVTNMKYMFGGCRADELDLSGFDTENVTDMSFMFCQCEASHLDISGFRTGKVKDMSGMFMLCQNITALDLSNIDTSSVTDMESMFSQCSSLTDLNVSSFDASKVRSMVEMFEYCGSLKELDLSSFRTSSLTEWGSMFDRCRSLRTLDISSFDTRACRAEWSQDEGPYRMDVFDACDSLKYIALGDKTVAPESLQKKGWMRFEKLTGESTDSPYIEDLTAYKGKAPGWYRYIVKSKNPMTVNTSAKTVKARRLKTAARTVKPITVKQAKGTVRYTKVSGSKKLTINKKTGKVKVKKKTKKGTYTMKVKVRAAGTHYYFSKAQTVTVKVKVR